MPVPLHAHHTAEDDELSAMLCAVESLQNGVTTVVAGNCGFTIAPTRAVRPACRSYAPLVANCGFLSCSQAKKAAASLAFLSSFHRFCWL